MHSEKLQYLHTYSRHTLLNLESMDEYAGRFHDLTWRYLYFFKKVIRTYMVLCANADQSVNWHLMNKILIHHKGGTVRENYFKNVWDWYYLTARTKRLLALKSQFLLLPHNTTTNFEHFLLLGYTKQWPCMVTYPCTWYIYFHISQRRNQKKLINTYVK